MNTQTIDPDTSQTVRGFHVLFRGKAGKRRKERALSYPCSGQLPFTGRQAIRCMETLAKRGIASCAYTSANGVEENLSLEEMREVVL